MRETRRTVRKVIGTGTVKSVSEHSYIHYLEYQDSVTNQLPVGTKVDLVAPAPCEKKMIKPDNEWIFCSHCRSYTLKHGKDTAALVTPGNHGWKWRVNITGKEGWVKTHVVAMHTAECELADRGKCGFSWETDLPEYSFYRIGYIGCSGLLKMLIPPNDTDYDAAYANYCKIDSKVALYGFRADGQVDILARKDGE